MMCKTHFKNFGRFRSIRSPCKSTKLIQKCFDCIKKERKKVAKKERKLYLNHNDVIWPYEDK
jgi:hypothetical protein